MMPPMAPPGPASPPSGNPGEAAAASAKVRLHLQGLEQALAGLPIGSDMHDAVVGSISKLSKAFPPTDDMPGIQNTALLGLKRSAQEGAMMRQLMASMGGGGGGPPGGPPVMGGGAPPPGM